MFYSYTRGEHKNMLGFPSINVPKFLLLSLKVLLQKRGMGYAKVIHKKKRKKEKMGSEKNEQVSEI
jgi:hypothetical protein